MPPLSVSRFPAYRLDWGLNGDCLARQEAMPRGLNGTHRELSLTGAVASDKWRPPALAGP